MKTNSKTLSAVLAAVALWTMLCTGCNTINGAGKDIERAGEKIQDKSGK